MLTLYYRIIKRISEKPFAVQNLLNTKLLKARAWRLVDQRTPDSFSVEWWKERWGETRRTYSSPALWDASHILTFILPPIRSGGSSSVSKATFTEAKGRLAICCISRRSCCRVTVSSETTSTEGTVSVNVSKKIKCKMTLQWWSGKRRHRLSNNDRNH